MASHESEFVLSTSPRLVSEKRQQTIGTKPDVCLWQTEITNSDNLVVEDHPKFRGVCVIQLNEVVEK